MPLDKGFSTILWRSVKSKGKKICVTLVFKKVFTKSLNNTIVTFFVKLPFKFLRATDWKPLCFTIRRLRLIEPIKFLLQNIFFRKKIESDKKNDWSLSLTCRLSFLIWNFLFLHSHASDHKWNYFFPIDQDRTILGQFCNTNCYI